MHPESQLRRNLMLLRILKTPRDPMLFVSRIILGLVMFAHGAQKVFGWFGGSGLQPTLQFFSGRLGIPEPFAIMAIAAEFLGGIALLLGLLGRIGAFGIAVNMIVSVFMVHLPNGLFMNWFGSKSGEGFEYHLLTLALAAITV